MSTAIPAARAPMKRIFFGNADSGGPESLASEAIRISRAGAEWVEKLLAGRPLAPVVHAQRYVEAFHFFVQRPKSL